MLSVKYEAPTHPQNFQGDIAEELTQAPARPPQTGAEVHLDLTDTLARYSELPAQLGKSEETIAGEPAPCQHNSPRATALALENPLQCFRRV